MSLVVAFLVFHGLSVLALLLLARFSRMRVDDRGRPLPAESQWASPWQEETVPSKAPGLETSS